MTEKELMKKSGFYTGFILFFVSLFWFLFSNQISFGGYAGGPASGIDVGINSRFTSRINLQPGSSGACVILLGIENVTGAGTGTGYMNGTDTYYPRIVWTPTLGTFNFVGTGSYPVTVQMNGVGIPSAGSVSGKIDAVGGTGTGNVFTDTTLAGLGTITSSFGANGLVISPAEYSCVDGGTSPFQGQITTATGNITNHAHAGTDSVKISHDNVIGTGTNSHAILDAFVASKASASGLASLDGSSLVVQNPASGTSTPGASKTVMSDGTGKIVNGWLSNSVTMLGTPTTSNIPEGSNLYYSDSRVNSVISSSSVGSRLNEQIVSVADGHHFVYDAVLGKWKNATSTASIGFGGVTGVPTDNAYFSATPGTSTVPYSLNGTLNNWITDIVGVDSLTIIATSTTHTGSTTAAKMVCELEQVSFPMHANTELLICPVGAGSSTSFVDSSVNNFTVTNSGTPYISPSQVKTGVGTVSIYLDGSSYLDVPNNAFWTLDGDCTIRGWIYPISAGMLLEKGTMSPDHYWRITSAGAFEINDTGGAFTASCTSFDSTPAQWQHFAACRKGNVYTIYRHGVAGTPVTNTGTRETSASTLRIGATSLGGSKFKGFLMNVEFIKGTALYDGNFTPDALPIPGTATIYNTNLFTPGDAHEFIKMKQPSIGYGTPSVCFINATTTVFNSSTQLGTSTLHAIHANGGILSNLGHFTLCFDDIKVITDSSIPSLRSKYLDSFYDIKIKESYARKDNMPWLDAADRAKRQYKQEKFETWKSANIGLTKYYVDEFLPGSGTAQSFQVGAFETDYNNFAEESWASDLSQNDYIQDVKDEQDMDRTKRMLRPSLSDPLTPKVVKATDGSALSLDDTSALTIMAIQEQDERLRSVMAEIKALKALWGNN